jgi:hypothetical protein
MGTEIKTWQIIDGVLKPVHSTLRGEGRKEPYDLEPWLASNPEIVGSNIAIIGQQVTTKSGIIDLLGIDRNGNAVIVELKRDRLPREVLAQAIDYASDVADWGLEKISEICNKHTGKGLDDFLGDAFPDVDLEDLSINDTQRIVLVGFSIESALERMIEWLADRFNVNINATVLNYIKTSSGDELLTRTSIISEELEQERVKKQKKFEIAMSDEPGSYETERLEQLLVDYLSKPKVSNRRIKDVLLPACLKKGILTREELKKELVGNDPHIDESRAGYYLTTMSSQLGMAKNDFLRQVISYGYPNYEWEKDDFSIRREYRELVKQVLEKLKDKKQSEQVNL